MTPIAREPASQNFADETAGSGASADAHAAGGAKPGRLRSWAVTAVKALVSGGLIWLIAANVDLAEVARRFADISPAWLALALAVVFVQIGTIALRWRLVLAGLGRELPIGATARFTLEGFFFNQALPSSIGGDAIRMMRASGALGSPRLAIQSVLLDRFLGVLGLVAIVVPAQAWAQGAIQDPLVRWALTAVVLAGGGAIAVFLMLAAMPRRLRGWRVLDELTDLSARAWGLLRSRRSPALIALSAVGQALAAIVFFVLAKALGVELSLVHALLLVPSALLVTLIPLSIAGWGLREGAVVTLLAVVGVAGEAALSLSLLFGLLLIAVSLPGGLLWILRPRKAAAAA